MIEPMKKEHAAQVAALHIKGISTGFISSLGLGFVESLYEAISESPYGFGFVDVENGRVRGFTAFTTNVGKLYKSVCLRRGCLFVILLFRKLFTVKTIQRLFQTLFYPKRTQSLELPQAELLSVAVDESCRGKGIAAGLIAGGLEACSQKGISQVKVLVADFNTQANRLYQKTGFTYVTQIESHGVKSNIYVRDVSGEPPTG